MERERKRKGGREREREVGREGGREKCEKRECSNVKNRSTRERGVTRIWVVGER